MYLETLNQFTPSHLKGISHKPIRKLSFMLDRWEVHLNAIIPLALKGKASLFKHVWVMMALFYVV